MGRRFSVCTFHERGFTVLSSVSSPTLRSPRISGSTFIRVHHRHPISRLTLRASCTRLRSLVLRVFSSSPNIPRSPRVAEVAWSLPLAKLPLHTRETKSAASAGRSLALSRSEVGASVIERRKGEKARAFVRTLPLSPSSQPTFSSQSFYPYFSSISRPVLALSHLDNLC